MMATSGRSQGEIEDTKSARALVRQADAMESQAKSMERIASAFEKIASGVNDVINHYKYDHNGQLRRR